MKKLVIFIMAFIMAFIIISCNADTKTVANIVVTESLDTISDEGLSDWELFIKHFPRKNPNSG